MFNLTTKFILAASILILGGFSAVSAQITNGSVIKVSVPSSFVVKDETLPAGVYTIERTPSTVDSSSLLIIRGDNGKAMIFDTMIGETNYAAKATELVFETVDGINFLSRIVVKGQTTVNELPKTKAQTRKGAVVEITNTGF